MSRVYEVGVGLFVSVAAVPPLDVTAKAMSVEDTHDIEGMDSCCISSDFLHSQ